MKLPKWLLEFSGHAYLHKYPMWVIYRPGIHKVKGPDVRKVLDIIKEGDILLRRFDGYLNTIFMPGFFGHAGLYVGDNQIIHAVSQGVISEDILNFCRADAICVLEVTEPYRMLIPNAVSRAKMAANEHVEYDFDFSSTNKSQYCTEMVDIAYSNIFYDDYQMVAGNLVLTPDGIRNSKRAQIKIELKP